MNEPMSSRRVRRREASLSPSEHILNRHRSRVLDPANDVRGPGQDELRHTVYVRECLLLRGSAVVDGKLPPELLEAAGQLGLSAEPDPADEDVVRLAREAGLQSLARRVFVVRVHLRQRGAHPTAPADAWQVLQRYRELVGVSSQRAKQVSLDHLLTATSDIEGTKGPVWDGHGIVPNGPVWDGHGIDVSPISQFGVPGFGGRGPVAWSGVAPVQRPSMPSRPPVVAMLDTGVGRHPWLKYPIVRRHTRVGALPIGLDAPVGEAAGRTVDTLQGELDPDAGHGTFIAGLIRQTCPDAHILSIRVMHGDGAVAKYDVLQALNRIVLRQAIALKRHNAHNLIDVVSLSMGYYHEEPADKAFDYLILRPLRELGRMGVVVVASAGNDATDRHMYPAGFAPHEESRLSERRDAVPVLSVGARNPDGRSIALFSNQAPWVTCYRPGSAVVSTMPTTFRGGRQPTVRLRAGNYTRQTLDLDNYTGGFGTWSGTSFAAPILAGELAEQLIRRGDLDKCDQQAAVDRGWAAVEAVTPVRRP